MIFNNFKSVKTITSGIKFLGLLSLVCVFLANCSVPNALKPKKISKDRPVNAQERARQNIEQGRGISLKDVARGRKSTTYEFSTSNPLWRASLETIDFMPLSSADQVGGTIITDWYSTSNNENERCKLNIFITGKRLNTENLKVTSFCQEFKNPKWVNIKTEQENNIKIENAILNKAKKLKLQSS